MDRLQTLRVFVNVVEHGGFARAGLVMNMANAVVSRHIADLESHLGARLLNRTTRRLSLTETGQIYLDKARQILEMFDEADAVAGADAKQARGTLRIFAPTSFGQAQLSRILPEYMKSQPNVKVEVTLSDRAVDIVQHGYDVGIFTDFQKFDSSMVVRQLAVTEVVLCASPDYIRRHGVPKSPDDLVNHVCLNLAFEELRHGWTFRPDGKGQYKVPITSKLTSNDGDLLRECALAGVGVLLRTSFSVNDDLTSGRLVRLLPNHHLRKLNVVMAYPSRRQVPAKLRSFVDFMAARFPLPQADPWCPVANLAAHA
ncbi:LysR family transcriptional regulator [Oxalobacteraceae bacterium OM1]|nr:LysR family transcriptional regulator [Oxalobacteraceae bacterium OM1]